MKNALRAPEPASRAPFSHRAYGAYGSKYSPAAASTQPEPTSSFAASTECTVAPG